MLCEFVRLFEIQVTVTCSGGCGRASLVTSSLLSLAATLGPLLLLVLLLRGAEMLGPVGDWSIVFWKWPLLHAVVQEFWVVVFFLFIPCCWCCHLITRTHGWVLCFVFLFYFYCCRQFLVATDSECNPFFSPSFGGWCVCSSCLLDFCVCMLCVVIFALFFSLSLSLSGSPTVLSWSHHSYSCLSLFYFVVFFKKKNLFA